MVLYYGGNSGFRVGHFLEMLGILPLAVIVYSGVVAMIMLVSLFTKSNFATSLIIFLRKELRSIAYQMEYNKAIRINTLNSEIENIACKINDLYEENNKVNIKSKRLTEDMKQSIYDLLARCFTMDESRSSQNTGLGLFISRTLIERLGGSIEGKVKNNELIIRIIWNS